MTILQNHRQKTSGSTAAKKRSHILITLVSLFFVQVSFAQTIKGIITGINMNRFLVFLFQLKKPI